MVILIATLVLASIVVANAQVVENISFYSEIIDTAEGGVRRVEAKRRHSK
jgi:hypothetical protein